MNLTLKVKSILSRIKYELRNINNLAAKMDNSGLDKYSTEFLSQEVARRIEKMPGAPMHDIFYRHGFHLLRKHFYLPIPDDGDDLEAFWDKASELVGLDMNEKGANHLMDVILPPFLKEFRESFSIEKTDNAEEFYLMNSGYMAVDAHLLYGLIRHHKPARILEIGNGNSTLLALEAASRNRSEGHPTDVVSIDPYPWDVFRGGYPGLSELIVKPVQEIPLTLFQELGENDILFIDSSHVIRSGNDVHYEFLEVLPRLNPGVLVHIHDISLPKPYPKVYYENQLYWNEQYLLQAFLAFNNRYEVIWPGNYMMINSPEKMLTVFPEINIMREAFPSSEPTAFWIRVKKEVN